MSEGEGATKTNLGFEACGDSGLEGVAETPHHAQPRVVLEQPAEDPTQIQTGRRMRNFTGKIKTLAEFRDARGGCCSYLALTHTAQQDGRLDPSQSAQLLLPRRDAILSRADSAGREGLGISDSRTRRGQITGEGSERAAVDCSRRAASEGGVFAVLVVCVRLREITAWGRKLEGRGTDDSSPRYTIRIGPRQ